MTSCLAQSLPTQLGGMCDTHSTCNADSRLGVAGAEAGWGGPGYAALGGPGTIVKEDRVDEGRERGTKSVDERACIL